MKLRLIIGSLLLLCVAQHAASAEMEKPAVELASELDVGLGMLKACSSRLYEASGLCNGRSPFTNYVDPTSSCQNYFWCAPGRGACFQACPTGTIFDTSCSCCRDRATTAVDPTTCSSSSTHQPTAGNTASQHRLLLGADTSTAQPSAPLALQDSSHADDTTVVFDASSRQVLDGRGKQLQLQQQQQQQQGVATGAVPPTRGGFGNWGPLGKFYSSGPFAGRNVVKEPAFKGTQPTTSTTPPSSSSSSRSGPIVSEIGSRPAAAAAAAAAPKLPVNVEDATPGETLATAPAAAAQQQQGTRQLSMKRMPPRSDTAPTPVAAASSATAATAGTDAAAAQLLRVQQGGVVVTRPSMHSLPPTAARALGPDDEADVPFVTTAATAAPSVAPTVMPSAGAVSAGAVGGAGASAAEQLQPIKVHRRGRPARALLAHEPEDLAQQQQQPAAKQPQQTPAKQPQPQQQPAKQAPAKQPQQQPQTPATKAPASKAPDAKDAPKSTGAPQHEAVKAPAPNAPASKAPAAAAPVKGKEAQQHISPKDAAKDAFKDSKDSKQQQQHQPKGPSSSNTPASSGSKEQQHMSRPPTGTPIPDIGKLSGPEADAAAREFAALPPVQLTTRVVHVPDNVNLRGDSSSSSKAPGSDSNTPGSSSKGPSGSSSSKENPSSSSSSKGPSGSSSSKEGSSDATSGTDGFNPQQEGSKPAEGSKDSSSSSSKGSSSEGDNSSTEQQQQPRRVRTAHRRRYSSRSRSAVNSSRWAARSSSSGRSRRIAVRSSSSGRGSESEQQ